MLKVLKNKMQSTIDKYNLEASHTTTLFKNKESFDFDYIPSEIHPRPEIEELVQELRSFVKYRVPEHILLIGGPGTGKTAIFNYLAKNQLVKIKNIQVYYVNCRFFDTTHKVICKLSGVNPRGIPTNEALNIFFEKQKCDCIIAIDEVDKLDTLPLQKLRSNLLYYFSRPGEITSNKFTHKISLVLISNVISWYNELLVNDPATASSLQLIKIVFPQYSLTDILRILELKAKEGLVGGCYDNEILEYISKLVNEKTHGDTRIGIMTLKLAVKYLENNGLHKLTKEIINQVYTKAILEVERETIEKLNPTVIKILYSCAIAGQIDSANSIYNHVYVPLCKNKLNQEPLAYVQFMNHLSYLTTMNLITSESEKKGRTRIKKIYLKTDKRIVETIWAIQLKNGWLT